MKNGFIEGCRAFLGLYGSYLKATYGSILLSTIAMNDNNRIFFVAVAIVEIKTWTIGHCIEIL